MEELLQKLYESYLGYLSKTTQSNDITYSQFLETENIPLYQGKMPGEETNDLIVFYDKTNGHLTAQVVNDGLILMDSSLDRKLEDFVTELEYADSTTFTDINYFGLDFEKRRIEEWQQEVQDEVLGQISTQQTLEPAKPATWNDSIKWANKAEEQFVKSVLESFNKLVTKQFETGRVMPSSKIPINGLTSKEYSTINAVNLLLKQWAEGYPSNEWFTFKQAQDAGLKITRGSKGTPIAFYRMYDKLTKKDFVEETVANFTKEQREEYLKENVVLVGTSYYVFNKAQMEDFEVDMDGYSEVYVKDQEYFDEVMYRISDSMDVQVHYSPKNGNAFYSPLFDAVSIPQKRFWYNQELFIKTLLHEFAHATGHPTRLDRFSDKSRLNPAKEELIAETAAVFTAIQLGLLNHADSVEYLKSWSSYLSDRPREFMSAVRQAMEVKGYLLDAAQMKNELVDQVQENKQVVINDNLDLKRELLNENFASRIEMLEEKMIAVAIETSGTNYTNDTITKLSIIDAEGGVLFESDHIDQDKPKIQNLINQSSQVVGFNFKNYANRFLANSDIIVPEDKITDLMHDFSKVHGEWNPRFKRYRWNQLDEIAKFYGTENYVAKENTALDNSKMILKCYHVLKNEALAFDSILDKAQHLTGQPLKGRLDNVVLLKDDESVVTLNLEKRRLNHFVKDETSKTQTIIQYHDLSILESSMTNLLKSKSIDEFINQEKENKAVKVVVNQEQKMSNVERVNQLKASVSILDYASQKLGLNVKHASQQLFTLAEHDSVRIYPDNTFARYSKSGSGGSIIDFVMEFDAEAVNQSGKPDVKKAISLVQNFHQEQLAQGVTPSAHTPNNYKKKEKFELPKRDKDNRHVIDYLVNKRGIDLHIVQEWIDQGHVYQTRIKTRTGKEIPNLVFAGNMGADNFKYAQIHGISSAYKQDVVGSIKIIGLYQERNSNVTVVTESPIDAMSHQTLNQHVNYNYLSVNGVNSAQSVIDAHLQYRITNGKKDKLILALDNDQAGQDTTQELLEFLKINYPNVNVEVDLPKIGKDFNDVLVAQKNAVNSTHQKLQKHQNKAQVAKGGRAM